MENLFLRKVLRQRSYLFTLTSGKRVNESTVKEPTPREAVMESPGEPGASCGRACTPEVVL